MVYKKLDNVIKPKKPADAVQEGSMNETLCSAQRLQVYCLTNQYPLLMPTASPPLTTLTKRP